MTNKVDLPRQLQRQQEEMEQYDRDIAAAANPDPATPPVETPGATDGQDTPPPAPPPPPAPVHDDQWEQRFRTLKGKYDAEVPRLHNELKELRTQLTELLSRTPKVETPKEPPRPKAKRVTEKDTETFGADLMDVVRRQAEDIAADALAELNEKVSTLAAENEQLKQAMNGVSTTQAATSQEVYFGKLTAVVPDWQTVNTDQGFLTWLGEIDEISGEPRQAHLNRAFESLDVERTAKLFNAYKRTVTPPVPPAPPAQKRTEVQRQVAPGKSKTPPGPASSDANSKIWRAAEIDEFYKALATGQYRNTPQEAARIEAEIDAAAASGRIRA